MKRPFIACGVLMFFMGGALMAVGAVNRDVPRPRGGDGRLETVSGETTFCAAPWPTDWDGSATADSCDFGACPMAASAWSYEGPAVCYRNCCGFDRLTGEHYRGAEEAAPCDALPRIDQVTGYDSAYDAAVYACGSAEPSSNPRGFSAVVMVLPEDAAPTNGEVAGPWQPRSVFPETAALLRSLSPWLDRNEAARPIAIPLAAEPPYRAAAPDFYDFAAAQDYATAQVRAAREEQSKISFRQLIADRSSAWDSLPAYDLAAREDICAMPAQSWVRFSDRLTAVCDRLRSAGNYPYTHNARIAVLWTERQTAAGLIAWRLDDDWRQAALYAGLQRKTAMHMDLDWAEYQQLMDRAIEQCPEPSKAAPRPQLRPLPSRQQMMRIAAQTLESLSDMLAWTASCLDGWAAEDVAHRPQAGSPRTSR
jgi:hypothetical protein